MSKNAAFRSTVEKHGVGYYFAGESPMCPECRRERAVFDVYRGYGDAFRVSENAVRMRCCSCGCEWLQERVEE